MGHRCAGWVVLGSLVAGLGAFVLTQERGDTGSRIAGSSIDMPAVAPPPPPLSATGLEGQPDARRARPRYLRLHVVDAAGASVPGADLVARDAIGGREGARGRTDVAGRAALPVEDGVGSLVVLARATDRGAAEVYGVVPGETEATVALRASTQLEVRVTEGDALVVAGATLALEVGACRLRLTGVTDASGFVVFPDLPAPLANWRPWNSVGESVLSVTVTRGNDVVGPFSGPTLETAGTTRWDLALERKIAIRVLAKDERGVPLAGAHVSLCSSVTDEGHVGGSAETSSEGRAVIAGVWTSFGPWLVRVDAGARGMADAPVQVPAVGESAGVVVVVRELLTVTGHVRDLDGSPIVGVGISVPGEVVESEPARTRSDGGFGPLFVVRANVPESGSLSLAIEGATGEEERTVAVPHGGSNVTAELTWPDVGSTRLVSGTVVLPDGSPAQGAWVRFRCEFEDQVTGEDRPDAGATVSDTFGRFRLRAPGAVTVGSHPRACDEVVATLPGYADAISTLPPSPQDVTPRDVRLRLELAPARRVVGRVIDEGGAPVEGVLLKALRCRSIGGAGAPAPTEGRADSHEFPDDEPSGSVFARGVTNARGEFELSGVPDDGGVAVRAVLTHKNLHGYSRWRAWKPLTSSSESVDLTLPIRREVIRRPLGEPDRGYRSVQFRFVDGAGVPIHDAEVLYVWTGALGSGTGGLGADESGSFPLGPSHGRLSGPEIGEVTVDVDVPEGLGAYERRVVIDENVSARLAFVWPPGVTPDDVSLRLVSVKNEHVTRTLRRGPDGLASVRNLAPGRWRVVADVLGDDSWIVESPAELDVDGAGEAPRTRTYVGTLVRGARTVVSARWVRRADTPGGGAEDGGSGVRPHPYRMFVDVFDESGALRARARFKSILDGAPEGEFAVADVVVPVGRMKFRVSELGWGKPDVVCGETTSSVAAGESPVVVALDVSVQR